MESNKQARAEARLNSGLRNYWYPVVASWQVNAAPIGITRLSQNIVVWRDSAGKVNALEDRCPHRGARLSMGWNLGDRVACWYHGVEVGCDGQVKSVPAVDNCPLEGRTCVRSYPVQELAGAIFLWFGDRAPTDADALQLPEELVSEEHSHFLCVAQWDCNYRYAIDNVMDPMHGAYLHAVSHSMASGEKSAVMQVVETEHGLIFEKTGQRGVNFDWVEFGETGTMWLRLSIPYRDKAGPGGPFGIVGIATPIDEEHCMVYFWRTRHVQGWERDVWRFLYRNRLEGLHWDVLEQDRVVLESMAPQARDHEMLYAHDAGITRVRRLLKRRADAEVADQPVAMLQPVSGAATHA
ncbi:aromatic ring-hydroxylating dioxygenase subunit alpha [Cupriavidus agavae]|uniref:Phenylpropionate dioxygenase-like ring-hydroxylating dioxygenase large terminal subunit n=1 Tax=Cupriavidus agavae TaxID=1001822 RepID=A0A4Q7RSW6_9BURK|nr:aromatic ring-hydroxylating dioxygenase subunit alpha [Cupriavidus agavae]RZT36766.1 phenylpropionate dioxygenase-like ring-hydroxylating dioxygenase large terminal subunit [Cupriavidus agavae]